MPRLRQNIITGDYVVIAPERAKRPEDFIRPRKIKELTRECPFCPGGKALKEVIKKASTKKVFVIPNKYPAFVKQAKIIFEASKLYYSQNSLGGHEVVIFADHHRDFESLTPSEITQILEVYQKRISEYAKDPAIEYVLVIHNHGQASGASVEHAHSQLFASSVMPIVVLRELSGAARFYEDKGRCVFCEIIKEEKREGWRIVVENEDFIGFCFFAPRFPFETWILPKNHLASFEGLHSNSVKKLAQIMSQLFTKLDKSLNDPPYNFYIHTLPTKHDHMTGFYHFHIEVLPRLSTFGGYELGSGIAIDVVSPEKAAQFLKKA